MYNGTDNYSINESPTTSTFTNNYTDYATVEIENKWTKRQARLEALPNRRTGNNIDLINVNTNIKLPKFIIPKQVERRVRTNP